MEFVIACAECFDVPVCIETANASWDVIEHAPEDLRTAAWNSLRDAWFQHTGL